MSNLRNPTKGPYATMAAAGTTQATAAAMLADVVMVTSGTGGVILPVMNVNEECVVCNRIATENINVYPQVGGKLNNATTNDPLVLPNNLAAHFRAIDGGGNVIAFF